MNPHKPQLLRPKYKMALKIFEVVKEQTDYIKYRKVNYALRKILSNEEIDLFWESNSYLKTFKNAAEINKAKEQIVWEISQLGYEL